MISYHYDTARRMDKKTAVRNGNPANLINDYKYGYNKVHMKTYEQRMHHSGRGDLFNYDEIHRLTGTKINVPETEFERQDQDPTYPGTEVFEKQKTILLDKNDNIKQIMETINGQTSQMTTSFDQASTDFNGGSNKYKLNQYERFDQWGLDYDDNGNTTLRGGQTLTYNYRNQLVSATDNATSANASYEYDALGRRIKKTVGSNTTLYYYSGNQVIEEQDTSGTTQKQYIYGNGIDDVIRVDVNENGTMVPYYYHLDGRGNVRTITDNTGNIVENYSYDIYGSATITDASGQVINQSSIGNEYMFQGRRYDRETNLYYYRARHYDPVMGRFLQTDPMGYRDSMNLYQGMNMNPVNFVDPFGEWSETNHARSIAAAFLSQLNSKNWYSTGFARNFNLTSNDVAVMIQANNVFDIKSQGSGLEFLHSMLKVGQSKDEAIRLRGEFKYAMLDIIGASRKHRYKNGDKRLWSKKELMLFGILQHPFVDETCPSHAWKVWDIRKPWEIPEHVKEDIDMSYREQEVNANIVRRMFTLASRAEKYDTQGYPDDVRSPEEYMGRIAGGEVQGYSQKIRDVIWQIIRIFENIGPPKNGVLNFLLRREE